LFEWDWGAFILGRFFSAFLSLSHLLSPFDLCLLFILFVSIDSFVESDARGSEDFGAKFEFELLGYEAQGLEGPHVSNYTVCHAE